MKSENFILDFVFVSFRFKVTLIFLILFSSYPGDAAGVDVSVSGSGRSYPQSGALSMAAGAWVPIWGQPGPSPLYGFLRAEVGGDFSLGYDQGNLAIEFYPIAFLGFRGTVSRVQNHADYDAYDCDLYICRTGFEKQTLESNLGLAMGPVFAMARLRQLWLKSDRTGFIVEPEQGIVFQDEDQFLAWNGILGFSIRNDFASMLMVHYLLDENEKWESRSAYVGIRKSWDQFSVVFGAGAFESRLLKEEAEPSAIIRVEQLWGNSPKLF